MSLPSTLKCSFTATGGQQVATQTVNLTGTQGSYSGTAGDFAQVNLINPAGLGYFALVNNLGGFSTYPTPVFSLTDSDSDPQNPEGNFQAVIDGVTYTLQTSMP